MWKNVLDKSRDKDIKYLQRATLKMYQLKQPYVSLVFFSVKSSQEHFLRFTMWTIFSVFSPVSSLVPSQKSALIYAKLCQNPLKYFSNMVWLQQWQTRNIINNLLSAAGKGETFLAFNAKWIFIEYNSNHKFSNQHYEHNSLQVQHPILIT